MGVCIDEGFSGLNDTEGDALFDEKGDVTPFLKHAIDFLSRYQREYRRTEAFCQRLLQADLLTEMNAKADISDGRTFTVNGLLVVDDKKLMALPDAAALSLFRAGELHLISLHLMSLPNMKRLVDQMAGRRAQLQPAPKPA